VEERESEEGKLRTGVEVFKDKIPERHLTSSFALTRFGIENWDWSFPSCD
jgi:hypothetical protein